jgi:hypothetical protein
LAKIQQAGKPILGARNFAGVAGDARRFRKHKAKERN